MERIKLNLIPSGVAPIVHLSQYDDGRKFGIDLFEGESVYVLDGTETLTVNSRKPDGHVVVITVTNTGTSSLDVDTVEQLTAVHGVSYAKLQIVKGSVTIATLPFLIDVSRDPLENGDPSESFIQNLQTQIAEGVAEEVAEQYDSSNVIFDNEPTENHGIGYTVTSEGIKTAIDNAFDYDNTVSGSLVHITDGADNIPVKSLVSEIVAVETGNGQPKSPDNPYTISGFDNGVITRCGKNLFDYTQLTSASGWTESGGVYSGSIGNLYAFASNGFPIQPKWKTNQQYVFKLKVNNAEGNSRFRFAYTDNTYSDLVITPATIGTYISVITAINKTVSNLIFFYNSGGNLSISEMCLNLGNTATNFETYNGNTYTFTFGQTVYGGHFDNKGNLVVTFVKKKLNELTWVYVNISGAERFYSSSLYQEIERPVSLDTVSTLKCSCYETVSQRQYAQFTSDNIIAVQVQGDVVIRDTNLTSVGALLNAVGEQEICYPLATPITLSITSQDIPTLLGENNIFSNCGDVEVTYYTSKSIDILEFIDSEIGKKNGTNIPIEEDSQDSIKDYIDDEVSSINATNLPISASDTTSTKG